MFLILRSVRSQPSRLIFNIFPMRAYQINSYGGPEVLKLVELADPQPKEGWV